MNTIILQFQQRSTHNGTHSKLLHHFKPCQHLMQLLKSYDHLRFHKKGCTQKKKNVALFFVLQNKDAHLLIFVGLYLISAGWTTTTSHRLAPYIANSSKKKNVPPRASAHQVPHQLQMMYEMSDSPKTTHIPIPRLPETLNAGQLHSLRQNKSKKLRSKQRNLEGGCFHFHE